MATNRSKRYEAAAKLVDSKKTYPLAEAVDTLKQFPAPKFDQTVTLSFHLGVDPKQSDQMVRGTCPLPNGSGKQVRVLVFATGQAATAAKDAGVRSLSASRTWSRSARKVSRTSMWPLRPLRRWPRCESSVKCSDPRGLMPNPKAGTVTDDTAKCGQGSEGGPRGVQAR